VAAIGRMIGIELDRPRQQRLGAAGVSQLQSQNSAGVERLGVLRQGALQRLERSLGSGRSPARSAWNACVMSLPSKRVRDGSPAANRRFFSPIEQDCFGNHLGPGALAIGPRATLATRRVGARLGWPTDPNQ
jgi:hypothetical protein